jgi:NodT family efflux transporter outer membrane factor (OMF) lipoprotein
LLSGKYKLTFLFFSAILLVGVFGCGRKAAEFESPVEFPGRFSASGEEQLPERWWLSLNDPNVDVLISKALSDNFTIRSTWDRLAQAQQLAAKAGASYLPEVSYSGSATRTRQKTLREKIYYNDYAAALSLSYELDLWGRVSSTQRSAALNAEAAREDLYAAALTLSGNIAKTWYQLVEAERKSGIVSEQLRVNEEVLELVTARFRSGSVGASDVFRQRQLVEATGGKLIKARESVMLLRHQLLVLLGEAPSFDLSNDKFVTGSFSLRAEGLVAPGPLPATGLPAVTIANRPDVMSAYRSLQSADMSVAAAVADQYPRISITSTAQTTSNRTRDLFDNWFANLAGNALGPVFDAGLRGAEVKRTKAAKSEALNNYGEAILQGLKEVEDAINQESYQREYLANLESQLELARQVYDRSRESYLKGKLDYLRVLDSLVSLQELEISYLNARRVLIERRVDLCKAVGGRIDLEPPEPEKYEEFLTDYEAYSEEKKSEVN